MHFPETRLKLGSQAVQIPSRLYVEQRGEVLAQEYCEVSIYPSKHWVHLDPSLTLQLASMATVITLVQTDPLRANPDKHLVHLPSVE